MWIEAIDILFNDLRENGWTDKLRGISGCAQQHGTVYWKNGAENSLKGLDESRSLAEQLEVSIPLSYSIKNKK